MKRILLCIFLACASQIFSQINVNGNVKDANNKPLGGVRIVSEDRRVMYSDARGGFIFPNVLLNSVLTFEITGFSKQDVAVDEAYSQNNMQVTLGISSRQLEEVACVSISAASETTHSKKIDKQTLEVNNYGQDIPFLLDQQPSVVATSDAGNGIGYTGIRVRGMDASRFNVTINGIPVNDPASLDVYWVTMPDLV
jgi:iron complex outermembrane receptor protein